MWLKTEMTWPLQRSDITIINSIKNLCGKIWAGCCASVRTRVQTPVLTSVTYPYLTKVNPGDMSKYPRTGETGGILGLLAGLTSLTVEVWSLVKRICLKNKGRQLRGSNLQSQNLSSTYRQLCPQELSLCPVPLLGHTEKAEEKAGKVNEGKTA